MVWIMSLVGLVILLLSGDLLVRGAVNLSLRIGMPALIISLTIVAFGTSAPEKDIFDHYVQINSNQYLENDSENIPTGRVMNVKGTRFDFKKSTRIRDKFTNKFKGFDENFIIKKNSRFVAKIQLPKSNISLKIFSNQPGVQFYTGQHLKYSSNRIKIKKYQGMCFETQGFPNAPNNRKFPSTQLNPSQIYKHQMKFEIGEIK